MPYPNCHENQRLKNKTYHTTHDILELSKSPVENHTLGISKFHKRCVPSSSWGEKPNKKFVQNLVYPRSSTRVVNEKLQQWVGGFDEESHLSRSFFFFFFIWVPIWEVDLVMGTRISDPRVCSSAVSSSDDDDENMPNIFLETTNDLPASSECPTSHEAVFLPTHLKSTPHGPRSGLLFDPIPREP